MALVAYYNSQSDLQFTVTNNFLKFCQDEVVEQQRYFGIIGVIDLEFACHILIVTERKIVANENDGKRKIFRVDKIQSTAIRKRLALNMEEEIHEKLMVRGVIDELQSNVYFSFDFDLISDKSGIIFPKENNNAFDYANRSPLNFETFKSKYFWNYHLVSPILKDYEDVFELWVLPCIRGFVAYKSMLFDGPLVNSMLISRISKENCGARYWNRGVDDEGNASFESESIWIFFKQNEMTSFCFLRGTIPLEWRQDEFTDPIERPKVAQKNNDMTGPNIRMESIERVTRTSLQKHFEKISHSNWKNIFVLDIVNERNESRVYSRHKINPDTDLLDLSRRYQISVSELDSYLNVENISLTNYKSIKNLKKELTAYSNRIGFFWAVDVDSDKRRVKKYQTGIIRSSSIDCLDDVNLTQLIMAECMLPEMLIELKLWLPQRTTLGSHNSRILRKMWADSGDALSLYYSGTRMADQSSRNDLLHHLTNPLNRIHVNLSRLYLGRFTLHRVQDIRDFMMGKHKLLISADTKTLKYNIKPTSHDFIFLRRKLVRFEQHMPFVQALFFFIRRITAPMKITNAADFVIAMIWLCIYVILVRFFRVPMKYFSRKPKSMIDISNIPNVDCGESKSWDIHCFRYAEPPSEDIITTEANNEILYHSTEERVGTLGRSSSEGRMANSKNNNASCPSIYISDDSEDIDEDIDEPLTITVKKSESFER